MYSIHHFFPLYMPYYAGSKYQMNSLCCYILLPYMHHSVLKYKKKFVRIVQKEGGGGGGGGAKKTVGDLVGPNKRITNLLLK